jgi:predicted amidohydrolase
VSDSLAVFTAAVAHAAPVFLNPDATLDKMEDIVADASRQGAYLVVFPEAFVPGFPLWAFVHLPIDIHPFARRLYNNVLDVPGRRIEWLGALARHHCLYLFVGVTERSPISAGTLYRKGPESLSASARGCMAPCVLPVSCRSGRIQTHGRADGAQDL